MSVAEHETRFIRLLMAVIERTVSAAELAEFRALLREHPEFKLQYLEQMRIHGLMCYRTAVGGLGSEIRGQRSETGGQRSAGHAWRRVAAAAAAALLVCGVWWWKDAGTAFNFRPPTSDLRPPTSAPPVRLVRQTGASGLELPRTLPGAVRLAEGQAAVRLISGVRLTLAGPLELEVHDALTMRLTRGRFLADVPPAASGFTVRTPELELWDIGTVFGVSVSDGVSDVFVFKGEVQVNEASGEAVDLCRAGEGVRARAGRAPSKVAADWPEARRLFASAGGADALTDPATAFAAADRIAELWEGRYLPEEAWRIRERMAREAASLAAPARIPFSKTAWVRPAAPARQQENDNMNKRSAAALAAAAVLTGAGTSGASSDPVLIDVSPRHDNGRWTTVFTNEIPLQWEWNAEATSAELEIAGMNGTVSTNLGAAASNFLWRAFASDAPTEEDTYALTLTFRKDGGTVVGALTARLAVVAGAFGEASVNPSPSDPKWGKVKGNAVIPYDAGWAAATAGADAGRLVIAKAGGAAQTNALPDAAGYHGWRIRDSDWGYGTFNLSLTFPGTEGEWDAALTRVPEGTMLSVR